MIYLTKGFLHQVRTAFNKDSQRHYKTSHIAEALASGYGYKSYSACLANINDRHVDTNSFNGKLFSARLLHWYPGIKEQDLLVSVKSSLLNVAVKTKFQKLFNSTLTQNTNSFILHITEKSSQVRFRINGNWGDFQPEDFTLEEGEILKSYFTDNDIEYKPLDAIHFKISQLIQTPFKGSVVINFIPADDGICIHIHLHKHLYLTPKQIGVPSPIVNHFNGPGITMIGGPTGSGKTTILLSLLHNALNQDGRIDIFDNLNELQDLDAKVFNHNQSLLTQHIMQISERCSGHIAVNETVDVDVLKNVLLLGMTGHPISTTIFAGSISQSIDRILSMKKDRTGVFSFIESINMLVNLRMVHAFGKTQIIFEYMIFNDYVKQRLLSCNNNYAEEIEAILNEFSGRNSDIVQCESFKDAFARAYKEKRISSLQVRY